MSKEIIYTPLAPEPIGPYSQAVVAPAGKTVYLSGQIGIDPSTGELAGEDFLSQAQQALQNMQQVIAAAGGTVHDIVKLTVFVTDLKWFGIANDLMLQLLAEPFPARSCVQVPALPKNALFEVEAILVVKA